MSASLDGYIVGPDGGFDWSTPDDEVFASATDEIRDVGVHLLGRRLYETMLYWETNGRYSPANAAQRGIPFFAHHGRREDLELVETRTFPAGVVALRYRIAA